MSSLCNLCDQRFYETCDPSKETCIDRIRFDLMREEYREAQAKYNEYFNKYIDLINSTLWDEVKPVIYYGELTEETNQLIHLFYGMSKTMQEAVLNIMKVTQERR